MFLLGIVSIFSAALVPGLVAVTWRSQNTPLPQSLFAAFFISVGWTYAKTMLLVAAGLFNQPILFIIFSFEVSALAYGLFSKRSATTPDHSPNSQLQLATVLKAALAVTLLLLSVRFVASTTLLGPRPFWSVWTHWDSIVSWNRWALNLADGKMPTGTWGYGQLIPSLWAYTYVFIGTSTVEVFAKMLSDTFPTIILLMQIDMIFRKGIVAGAFGWLALAFFSQTHPAMWTFHPMADIPLAAAVYAAVYFALNSDSLPESSARFAWFTCFLATGIAAAIKQQGLMLLFLGPLIFQPFFTKSLSRSFFIKCWALSLVLGIFWYMHFAILSFKGIDRTNLANLLTITGQSRASHSLFGRLNNGIDIWVSFFGPWIVYAAIPATLALCTYLMPRLRRFILLFLVPYFFIWAVGFSYDIRNALLIFPILCLVFGIVVSELLKTTPVRVLLNKAKVNFINDRILRYRINLPIAASPGTALAAFLVSLVSSSACFGLSISEAELKAAQETMSWDKGVRSINIKLRQLLESKAIDNVAVTNYEVMCYMDRFREWKPLFRFLKEPKEIEGLLTDPKIQSFIIWKQGIANLPALYDLTNKNFMVVEDSTELLVLRRK